MSTFLLRFAVSVGVSSAASGVLANAFALGPAAAVALLAVLTALTMAAAAILTSDFLAAAVRGEPSRRAAYPTRQTTVSVLWGAIRIETGPALNMALA